MKTKYIFGIIVALIFIFIIVSATNAAINGKKNKFITQESFSIASGEILSLYADEIAQGEFVDVDGNLIGKVRSRNYITVTGDATTNYVVREVTDFTYPKDFENPDNDNLAKKTAIQQGVSAKYGYAIPLQNIFYNKKTKGNQ